MSWPENSHAEVSKPFPSRKITFNNHLPHCAKQAQMYRNGTGFTEFSMLPQCKNICSQGVPICQTHCYTPLASNAVTRDGAAR
jgi:hypothetical protein